ncbi:hypothetical protein COY93_01835 [Candidatus Uhrbacteria bacterium CG_4_10_14_0_8_um_filter_58_22]|uniref:Uncharacterized protein n=1 Tax=Candidatus Uhrbacteria bacterium CG_4_10_14_0_8_um_filter_58_22 TaxID=1975029 RepID=A0A2M7QAC9_9BACT|nr:MAG: hypothetical protein AUJ19_02130 [Parcubacteria group bacterium CG1_02_58_44]PIY62892.1 MAG: hypothetical protein COY93_01835 [Candidatus Uhrbacteria bacterium CG_4_10_14_0_8_um_filter_58_22]
MSSGRTGLRRMPSAARVGPLRRRSALTLGVRPSPAGSGPSPDASEVAAGGIRRGDRIGLRHVRTGRDRIVDPGSEAGMTIFLIYRRPGPDPEPKNRTVPALDPGQT